jgi:hypothetical protein
MGLQMVFVACCDTSQLGLRGDGDIKDRMCLESLEFREGFMLDGSSKLPSGSLNTAKI